MPCINMWHFYLQYSKAMFSELIFNMWKKYLKNGFSYEIWYVYETNVIVASF